MENLLYEIILNIGTFETDSWMRRSTFPHLQVCLFICQNASWNIVSNIARDMPLPMPSATGLHYAVPIWASCATTSSPALLSSTVVGK